MSDEEGTESEEGIELSEEAFALFYSLREQLTWVQKLIPENRQKAGEELAQAIEDLSKWLGPGMP